MIQSIKASHCLQREHILLFRLRTVSSSNSASTKCVRQLRIIADPKTSRPPRFLSQPNGTLLLANLEQGLYTPDNVFHRFVVHADGNAVEFTLMAGNEAGWFQLGARSGKSMEVEWKLHFEGKCHLRTEHNSGGIYDSRNPSNSLPNSRRPFPARPRAVARHFACQPSPHHPGISQWLKSVGGTKLPAPTRTAAIESSICLL